MDHRCRNVLKAVFTHPMSASIDFEDRHTGRQSRR
jgi:hypothetical protein